AGGASQSRRRGGNHQGGPSPRPPTRPSDRQTPTRARSGEDSSGVSRSSVKLDPAHARPPAYGCAGVPSTEPPRSKYSRHDAIFPPTRSTMIASCVTPRTPSLRRVTSQSHSIATLVLSGEAKTFDTVTRKSAKR